MNELVTSEAARKGIYRKSHTHDQTMDRILTRMQTVGRAILGEGITQSPGAIDVAIINGYGFHDGAGANIYGGIMIDWNDAFENGAYIDGAADYPKRWADLAAQFRRETQGDLDVPYGDGARMVMDLFYPDAPTRGLFVFVHGGYWKAFDKSYWSHLAMGAMQCGWAVAMPSYRLAPDARLSDITKEIAQAISVAAEKVEGPIRLSGHSAGGHLVSRMACQVSPRNLGLQNRLEKIVSISGLHDLRPLLLTKMNDTLRLTEDEAEDESAALQFPTDTPFTAWVGAGERPEFLRQTRLIAEHWPHAKDIYAPNRHHFNVIDGLADPNSTLLQEILS